MSPEKGDKKIPEMVDWVSSPSRDIYFPGNIFTVALMDVGYPLSFRQINTRELETTLREIGDDPIRKITSGLFKVVLPKWSLDKLERIVDMYNHFKSIPVIVWAVCDGNPSRLEDQESLIKRSTIWEREFLTEELFSQALVGSWERRKDRFEGKNITDILEKVSPEVKEQIDQLVAQKVTPLDFEGIRRLFRGVIKEFCRYDNGLRPEFGQPEIDPQDS